MQVLPNHTNLSSDAIAHFFDKPESIGAQHVPALENLLQEYPWFQTAHVWYALALQDAKSLKYPEQLKMAAAHVPNRKVLYTLLYKEKLQQKIDLHEEALVAEPLQITEQSKEVAKEVSNPNAKVSPEVEKIHPISEPIVEKETETLVEKIPELKNEKSSNLKSLHEILAERERLYAEIENNKKAEEQITQETDSKDTIEPIPVLNVVEKSKETKQNEPTLTEEKPKDIKTNTHDELDVLEREILRSAFSASILPSLQQKEENESEEEAPATGTESGKTAEPNSFTDWLNQSKKTALPKVSPAKEQQNVTKTTSSKKSKLDIISDFINKAPEISTPKAEFFSPQNIAKLSIIEDESMVTETLANIYAKQKDFKKAIKAFTILIDKYPEKKRTFGARIKELELYLNS